MDSSETLLIRASLSGDFGWGDNDELDGMNDVGSALLLLGTVVYGASLWMTSGLLSFITPRNASDNEHR